MNYQTDRRAAPAAQLRADHARAAASRAARAARFDEMVAGALPTVPVCGTVCLFRALPGIGDLLTAIPAIRAIRAARPDVVMTLLTLPVAAPLAARFGHLVDEILDFPGFPGLPDRAPDLPAIPRFLAAMQDRRFDLALQLHGTGRLTNEIVALFGASTTAGFHPEGDPPFERGRYLEWLEAEPEVRRWLRLAALLGCASTDERLELPLAPDADDQVGVALPNVPFIVVHPGASAPERRWSADAFGHVSARLAGAGVPIVLTGSADELQLGAVVGSRAGAFGDVVDLTGRTTLDALGAVVRRASLVISNDTGVAHVADALGSPSIVVFTSTDPGRWAALDPGCHVALTNPTPDLVADLALRRLGRLAKDAA